MKVLAAAENLNDDAAAQASLFQKAYELGSKDPVGYSAAVRALDLFTKSHPERLASGNEAALSLEEKSYALARPADKAKAAQPYLARLLVVAEQRVSSRKTSEALALLRKAIPVAGIAAPETRPDLQARIKYLADREPAEKKAAELYEHLFANRDDQEALAKLVRLLLLELDSPEEAADLAPDSKDPTLKQLLTVLGRGTDTWTLEEAQLVAGWFEEQAKSGTSSAQRVALERTKEALERQLEVYGKEDLGKAKIKLTLDRIGESLKRLEPASAAVSKATSPRRLRTAYAPGLLVRQYARHASQDDNLYKGWVPPEELGKPVGQAFVATSLLPLKFPEERNVVASGFLKIDESGEYAFNADSTYDRVALYIKGELICPFRDGETTVAKITLEKGIVPIQVVGMVLTRGECKIQWQPPSAKSLGAIPPAAMLHTVE
ncbi:MAG TPA: hypothetical protein VMP01_04625 [Pirellulaceae bacterium]|nr:hypothetical protein [Pirellulaceae bacterium]